MSNSIPYENPYTRGKQILRALHEHGALSNWGLRRVLWPPLSKSSVRQAVNLLRYKELIVPRFDSLPRNCGNFFQLSLREETRPVIAKMINVHSAELQEHIVRDQELSHSQDCAVWCVRFRRMFSEAVVSREYHYVRNELLKDILYLGRDDSHLRPDILMHFTKNEAKHSTTIAIEIERSRKADSRVVEKLRKLSTQARIDGVIYICSTDSIREAVRRLYEEKVRERALRINHYGDNFFLFTNGDPSARFDGPIMLNSELKPVPLFDWVDMLVKNSQFARREANLKLMANAQSYS